MRESLELAFDDVPDDPIVDVVVAVHEDVAEDDDASLLADQLDEFVSVTTDPYEGFAEEVALVQIEALEKHPAVKPGDQDRAVNPRFFLSVAHSQIWPFRPRIRTSRSPAAPTPAV